MERWENKSVWLEGMRSMEIHRGYGYKGKQALDEISLWP